METLVELLKHSVDRFGLSPALVITRSFRPGSPVLQGYGTTEAAPVVTA